MILQHSFLIKIRLHFARGCIIVSIQQTLPRFLREVEKLSMQLEKDISELKRDVAELKKDVAELKEDVSVLKTQLRDIQLTLENVIGPNIRLIAEGHLDLSRKLDEALKIREQDEMVLLRLNNLENEVRKLKKAN